MAEVDRERRGVGSEVRLVVGVSTSLVEASSSNYSLGTSDIPFSAAGSGSLALIKAKMKYQKLQLPVR